MVLASAEGRRAKETCEMLGLNRATVAKWRGRYRKRNGPVCTV